MHCSVIEHGYDVIEFSNCNTEERGVSRVLLCSLKTKVIERDGSDALFAQPTGIRVEWNTVKVVDSAA